MNPQRKAEIKRLAHDRAARELSAVLSEWDVPQRLFDDEEERVEFEVQVIRIIHALEAQGR